MECDFDKAKGKCGWVTSFAIIVIILIIVMIGIVAVYQFSFHNFGYSKGSNCGTCTSILFGGQKSASYM